MYVWSIPHRFLVTVVHNVAPRRCDDTVQSVCYVSRQTMLCRACLLVHLLKFCAYYCLPKFSCFVLCMWYTWVMWDKRAVATQPPPLVWLFIVAYSVVFDVVVDVLIIYYLRFLCMSNCWSWKHIHCISSRVGGVVEGFLQNLKYFGQDHNKPMSLSRYIPYKYPFGVITPETSSKGQKVEMFFCPWFVYQFTHFLWTKLGDLWCKSTMSQIKIFNETKIVYKKTLKTALLWVHSFWTSYFCYPTCEPAF